MARRKPDEGDDVSLFPFLSILACVIGTLTLMISALALGQMDTDAFVSAEQYEKARRELEETEKDVAELSVRLKKAQASTSTDYDAKRRELAELREKLEQLQQKYADALAEAGKPQPAVQIPTYNASIQQQIDRLKQQLVQLKVRVAQLEQEVALRKDPPSESDITILPSGSGVGFDPVFVECANGSVVLHNTPTPKRIVLTELAQDATFTRLLTDVARSRKKSMIFLVRHDGVSSWRTARAMASSRDARNGKLPVIGQGRIDLRYFHKKT